MTMSEKPVTINQLPLHHLFLQGGRRLPVKSLSGFNKAAGHREPDAAGEECDAFLQLIGAAEVEKEGEALFRLIRQEFDYRRRDLRASAIPGAFTLITPDFTLRLWIEGDRESPNQAIIQREITELKSAELIQSAAFANAFSTSISRLCLTPTKRIEVEELIDRLEENSEWRKGLDYPPDASRLSLRWAENGPALQVNKKEVTFTRGADDDLLVFLQTGCRVLAELF
jgi:hypothetical protein